MKVTESINPESIDIDLKSTAEIVRIINDNDKKVALAVEKALPEIAAAVDMLAKRIKNGGRVFYIGAGTSGRLGIVDAAECPPTYGVPAGMFQGIIAGGKSAVFKAREFCEDKENMGAADLMRHGFSGKDTVVGLSCSGRTPYVLGALKKARSLGAKAISIICNPEGVLCDHSDISIRLITGPEVITGSTRMKAGTAEKMVLNMLSTGAMIKCGHVCGNLMADMQISCEKLRLRAINMIAVSNKIAPEKAEEILRRNKNHVRNAMNEARRK